MRSVLLASVLCVACQGGMASSEELDASGADAGASDSAGPPASDGGAAADGTSAVDAGADTPIPTGPDGLFPIITGFRVENAFQDRLYFDSSEAITGTDASGFVISGKTIVGLVVILNRGTGHYFSVSEPFDFYDNSTVRYEDGSDVRDLEGNAVHPFTMRYVQNRIPEPDASLSRFVSVSATGSGDGTSEAEAWTIPQAVEAAAPGMTVWIKAGDYGDQEIAVAGSGTLEDPIKFVGYRDAPGDIDTLYFEYAATEAMDPAQMPLLDHRDGGTGTAVRVSGDYVFVENIQVTNYANGFAATNDPLGVVFRRCLAHTLGRTEGQPGDQGMGFRVIDHDTRKVRILDSTVVNASIDNFIVYGSHNLIQGSRSYCDRTDLSAGEATDYYFVLAGTNSIFRDNHAERAMDNTHNGHGICFRNSSLRQPVEYNLAENSSVVGIGGSIEFRHENIRHNVARNITISGGVIPKSSRYPAAGPIFRDGASYNVVENSVMRGMWAGIRFRDTSEEGTEQAAGNHNRVVNSIVEDCEFGVWAFDDGPDVPVVGNEITGCVFSGLEHLYSDPAGILEGPTNLMRNTIIVDVPDRQNSGTDTAAGFVESYNSYSDGFAMMSGEGNIAVAPVFEGSDGYTPTSPALRVGTAIMSAPYDLRGVERHNSTPTIGAVEIRD